MPILSPAERTTLGYRIRNELCTTRSNANEPVYVNWIKRFRKWVEQAALAEAFNDACLRRLAVGWPPKRSPIG